MENILEISKKIGFEKNIIVTADGDLELVIPLLKTNCESINIRATIEDVFLNIEVKSNEIGNNNDSAMKFYYAITNFFMRNVGNVSFRSSLNFAASAVEIHLDNEAFLVQIIEKIKYIFNDYKDGIERELA